MAWTYFQRALRLRCPECGISRIFPPLSHMRRLADLFTPLDGCPRCGYPYEREMGYFLMATWAVSYGVGSMVGLSIYLYMEYVLESSLRAMLWTAIPAVMLVNLLFARHGRSLWLAIDHFFDPHVRRGPGEGGGDGGNGGNRVPRGPAPAAPPRVDPAPAFPTDGGGERREREEPALVGAGGPTDR